MLEVNLNFFGEGAVFEHAGIATMSIDDVAPGVQKIVDPIQKVAVALYAINGFKIELVQPLSDDSPVNNLLEKGQSLYHLCFKVPDITKSIKIARTNGFHSIAKPVSAVAFGGRKIVWLFSSTYGLIELLEADEG